MFPYNIVEQQGAELIHKCAEKNIGFIVMKPLAGGAIEDASLALRYVCSNPDVTVVIPGMAEIHELEQNLAACSNTEPLTQEELKEMDKVREQLGTDFCRRCNYCAPCPWRTSSVFHESADDTGILAHTFRSQCRRKPSP